MPGSARVHLTSFYLCLYLAHSVSSLPSSFALSSLYSEQNDNSLQTISSRGLASLDRNERPLVKRMNFSPGERSRSYPIPPIDTRRRQSEDAIIGAQEFHNLPDYLHHEAAGPARKARQKLSRMQERYDRLQRELDDVTRSRSMSAQRKESKRQSLLRKLESQAISQRQFARSAAQRASEAHDRALFVNGHSSYAAHDQSPKHSSAHRYTADWVSKHAGETSPGHPYPGSHSDSSDLAEHRPQLEQGSQPEKSSSGKQQRNPSEPIDLGLERHPSSKRESSPGTDFGTPRSDFLHASDSPPSGGTDIRTTEEQR